MADPKSIDAREADQRLPEELGLDEKGGRPVSPVEAEDRLTPEQEAALERLLASAWPLGIGRLNRDELHERR